jgi:ribosomal protein S18 acetylase RimI-like enzyme
MRIRPAESRDHNPIAAIIVPVIRAGHTYALDPAMSEGEALGYWLSLDKAVFVAEDDEGRVFGTYYLRTNQSGGGAHVCNCGYATAEEAGGRGIGRAMAEHSLAEARTRGYRAMQFNFVVSTNERAVRLWQSLGFEIVGRLPDAFRDPAAGYVDALVMSRAL